LEVERVVLNALTKTCDSAPDICAFGESSDIVFGEADSPDQLRRGSFQLNQQIRHHGFCYPCAFCPSIRDIRVIRGSFPPVIGVHWCRFVVNAPENLKKFSLKPVEQIKYKLVQCAAGQRRDREPASTKRADYFRNFPKITRAPQ
jgi:hypothetical protein